MARRKLTDEQYALIEQNLIDAVAKYFEACYDSPDDHVGASLGAMDSESSCAFMIHIMRGTREDAQEMAEVLKECQERYKATTKVMTDRPDVLDPKKLN